ncbi:general amino acid permease [Boletus edulis BED1]|uniref:General amino acid permease n=1 Tax=Boletus edulis BED1 TaxID=1328754 RepID=A0AAD4GLQ5_BOLED|nr:general amino acid permease [Boletus edulis BED1]
MTSDTSSPSYKGPIEQAAPGDFVYDPSLDHVKRQFGKQHIQMIAFTFTWQVLPMRTLRLLLVYFSGLTRFSTILSVGEMTAFAPISGSLLLYVARWLDPAVGFALGWNYFYFVGIAIPLELTAFYSMVRFWDTNPAHGAIYIAAFIVALLLLNLFGVRWFGNSEIFFASLKIILAVGLYWRNPGPFVSLLEPGATGRFLGILVAITPAAFSLSGIELISITAAEAQQPRTNIIKAMRTVIFRLIFFYIASVIVVGMVVPSNNQALLRPGASAAQSPFVIAFQRAGVKVLPSIINAVLITSAFSASNTFVFSGSRILYGLAVQKKAPKIFTTCTRNGLPWVAVIAAWLFSFLAFMVVSTASATVFNWFVSLATMSGFIGWITLNTTYLRYYYGLRRQGIVPRGIYRSPLQPYASMWAIFWIPFYILLNGLSVFWDWNASKFVAAYISLPVFLVLFIGYKLRYKTKITPLAELDFVSNVPTLEETGDEELLLEKMSFAKKLRELI